MPVGNVRKYTHNSKTLSTYQPFVIYISRSKQMRWWYLFIANHWWDACHMFWFVIMIGQLLDFVYIHTIRIEDLLVDIIEVTNAISALNANKSDVSLGLYSNHLLIASSHLHRYIAMLFTFMLRHGHNPDYIMEAIISTIPKNANGHISDSENYRGIALSSAIGKVLDIIIMNRYSNELMSSNLQFSFKPKHSTVMCTAAMRKIVSHYTSRSSRVYMCALDAIKAFDRSIFLNYFTYYWKETYQVWFWELYWICIQGKA